jgi:hypothetical protein
MGLHKTEDRELSWWSSLYFKWFIGFYRWVDARIPFQKILDHKTEGGNVLGSFWGSVYMFAVISCV